MKNALLCLISVVGFATIETESPKTKYIFYDVNPGEGFNLRRDVFMRIAILVRNLNIQQPDTRFILVLPPWGPLYHWQSQHIGDQSRLEWSQFFDTESLSYFVPVIELNEYLSEEGNRIDFVYYLQGYEGGWKDGKFEEKFTVAKCLDRPVYRKDKDKLFEGFFWNYSEIRATKMKCLSVQGSTRVLQKFLIDSPVKSIMLDRAETLLHDYFGDSDYWGVRRAMRFATPLVQAADNFRLETLNSSDEQDNTQVKSPWTEHRASREERGGPYACVHLRRKDYVRARSGQIPSIKGAADQLSRILTSQKLEQLYVATDAPIEEYNEFRSLLPKFNVVKFQPDRKQLERFKDGGVAIIDQLICSHAKYFIGSYESTFSFRIQEEREIMGFPVKSTFDMLCPDGANKCEKGSQWKIDWGKADKKWSIKGKTATPSHTEL